MKKKKIVPTLTTTMLYNFPPNVVTRQHLKITDNKKMPEKRKMKKSVTVIEILFQSTENIILTRWI